MQVDVSPDGRTILFDLLGDLYTMPIAGGEAKRIMGGLSFESQPTWSPDGKTIAFLTDRTGVENLWIADADGSNPRAVSKRAHQRPAADHGVSGLDAGRQLHRRVEVAPPDPGTFWLFMYHRDGGGVRVSAAAAASRPEAQGPPPAPPTNRMGAVVSPDGRFIYYTQRTGTFTYNARFPLADLPPRYGDRRRHADHQRARQRHPARALARRQMDGVWHASQGTDGAARAQPRDRRRALARLPVTRDDQESRASRDTLPRYDFMPDGKSLIVPVNGKLQRIDFASGEATPIPFTAKVEAEIAPRVYSTVRVDDGDKVRRG